MPVASTTDIQVAQNAATFAGLSKPASFTSGTLEATVLNDNYEDVVEKCLTQTWWNFATVIKQASFQAEDTSDKWSNIFQLPTDPKVMSVQTVTIGGVVIAYDIYEDNLYCHAGSADEVMVTYTFRPDTNKWPSYFRTYVQWKLATLLASVVIRKADIIEQMAQQAAISLSEARTTDAQQVTPQRIQHFRMIAARRGARTGG